MTRGGRAQGARVSKGTKPKSWAPKAKKAAGLRKEAPRIKFLGR